MGASGSEEGGAAKLGAHRHSEHIGIQSISTLGRCIECQHGTSRELGCCRDIVRPAIRLRGA
ncbi:hypothetical protein COLSTE_00715 [Collinsella stercoris DSM 13279]|uniref:Uncharacterized protein n=1 Tax=Collinsella stercoris DSM 13279 TaxID=445975 RepID=B6G9H4_9ACTN|nr:hypothetical protein COLSTE_00715 [Collinsella stercoris DSM 13279]